MQKTLAAAIQMVSSNNRDDNLQQAGELIRRAADDGAGLVVLPENFGYMGRSEADKLAVAEDPGRGAMQDFLADTAAAHHLWIVGGTIPLRHETGGQRAYAACLVYNDSGACVSRFDKIHLFDVAVPESGEQYKESASTIPGTRPEVVDTPFGRLGLSVCYDLRFPELYRQLVSMGAEILTVPSAFTDATGRAHWRTLVQARAIENLCYVVAPNQGGRHASGRETHGHSMIVNPWGQVLGELTYGPGVASGEIDLGYLQRNREHFPCLSHRRL
ncbi:MAG: acyltransferase [Salinisphaeraceae bacterium]|nr:acyltransferase [Salinisphaeraceae bacterium]